MTYLWCFAWARSLLPSWLYIAVITSRILPSVLIQVWDAVIVWAWTGKKRGEKKPQNEQESESLIVDEHKVSLTMTILSVYSWAVDSWRLVHCLQCGSLYHAYPEFDENACVDMFNSWIHWTFMIAPHTQIPSIINIIKFAKGKHRCWDLNDWFMFQGFASVIQ